MKLDEAIKILTEIPIDLEAMLTEDDCEAIKLGIEAFKRLQTSRNRMIYYEIEPLPGETKD